jgi:hypothetical protein
VTLRPDEAWRSQMSARDRRLVTMVGLPYLVRYQLAVTGRAQEKSLQS